jgi:hypothetical protein
VNSTKRRWNFLLGRLATPKLRYRGGDQAHRPLSVFDARHAVEALQARVDFLHDEARLRHDALERRLLDQGYRLVNRLDE